MPRKYRPGCEPPSKIWVNNTRIPVGDVDIYMRKEGPLDVTRYVEGNFFSPFNIGGEPQDFTQVFNLIDGSESPDELRIEVYNEQQETYFTEFHGIVTGVGNSGSDHEKEWQFRAQGPGLLLNKRSAAKTFKNGSVDGILGYVNNELEDIVGFDLEANPSVDQIAFDTNLGLNVIEGGIETLPLIQDYDFPGGSKTFRSNKDTLDDIIGWLGKRSDSTFWFEPTNDGAVLVGTQRPTAGSHVAQHVDDDSDANRVKVLSNDALVELNPINTMIVRGKANASLFQNTPFEIEEINVPDISNNEYNFAKARHVPLYERAGETEYIADTLTVSGAQSKQEVKNEARSLLKEKIDETTGGDMTTLLTAHIKPFDTIKAKPTCQGQVGENVEPIEYEISRVHHQIRAGSEQSKTKLNVGVRAATDDIEIVSTGSAK